MALKNLSTESMIELSTGWTDPSRGRKLLADVPLLAALLPSLDGARALLIGTTRPASTSAVDERLGKLRVRGESVDRRHDRKLRGVWLYLGARAELAETAEEAQQMLDLRDHLLPKGLSTTQLAYAEEAGNAATVKEHLDAATRAALRKIKVSVTRTLEDEVDAWLDAGAELGRVENQRRELERQRDTAAAGGPSRGDALRARNGWIKATNALVTNLDLADVDDETRDGILAPLREAEARADRRAASARKDDGAPEEGEPGEG